MIDVAFTPEEATRVQLADLTAVVLDVVRASTTIVAALEQGAPIVVPVASPDEALARARAWAGEPALAGGERGGVAPPGFDCGNSPAEYTAERIRGRPVVFTTTNGTRALLAVAGARRVAIGGFVNAGAVARWAADEPGDVLLVCGGEKGRFCLEDAVCAGLLVERLSGSSTACGLTDAARAATILWRGYADDLGRILKEATWARVLVAQGQGADLPLCLRVDVSDVVPVAHAEGLIAVRNGVSAQFDRPPGPPP